MAALGGEGKGPGGLPRHKMELPHYPTLFTWPDDPSSLAEKKKIVTHIDS